MIHSASFLATGSDIPASACVASEGLCLRTRSMTFSSASVSDCEVDVVAATAAGATGLRAGAGGKAACWRVAGAMAGAAGAAVAGFGAGAVFLAAVLGAGLVGAEAVAAGILASRVLASRVLASRVLASRVLGTTLRAIGRGLGVGTFGLAQASAANPVNPTANASVTSARVPKAVRRNVGGGTNGVTAFLRGESIKR